MMVRWYRENPLDGNEIARSIQVGLPAEIEERPESREGVSKGHTVPEADREVFSSPIALQKDKAVPGLPMDNVEDSSLVKVDWQQSDPKKLMESIKKSDTNKF